MNETKKTFRSYAVNLLCIVLLFVLIAGMLQNGILGNYSESILMLIGINVILAVSLNLTTGFLGQLTLGHAGFMSIGAYISGIISKALTAYVPDAPLFVLVMIAGGIGAAFFGIVVGIPALRLKGDYLAIITLGFGEIIRVVIENLEITGGAQGLSGIPMIASFPAVFWTTVVTIVLLYTFVRSRHGRAITAIREDDIAASASGIPGTYYKVLTFSMAAFFAGVAGAVYAHHYTILSAKSFGFLRSIDILVIVVLGGMGSITGSILSAIFLTVLPEALRTFSEYRMVVYSLALIVVMIFKPSGLLGHYEFSLSKAIGAIKKRVLGKKAETQLGAKGGKKQ